MRSAANIVIGVLVLAWILYRQLRPRAVREDSPYRVMAILAIIGVLELAQFSNDHRVPSEAWAYLVVSLVIGAGFGVLRGRYVHVWRQDGVLTRQGNVSTIVLWVVGIAIHLGFDTLIGRTSSEAKGLASTAILLYLAIALAAQQYVTLRRAEHLKPGQA